MSRAAGSAASSANPESVYIRYATEMRNDTSIPLAIGDCPAIDIHGNVSCHSKPPITIGQPITKATAGQIARRGGASMPRAPKQSPSNSTPIQFASCM